MLDIILCVGVLAHVKNVEHVVYRCSTLLKKGGKIIIEITPSKSIFQYILWPFYFIRNLIDRNPNGYVINKITDGDLISQCDKHSLKHLHCKHHSYPFTGLKKLPVEMQRKWAFLLCKDNFLFRIGLEHLFLFEKKVG